MFHVTKLVTTIVKWITVNALIHGKFEKFLVDNDADYVDVVMFTSLTWLSRSACLKKFYDLLPKIKMLRKKDRKRKRHLST